jgi:hypothetical protein
MKIIYKLSSSTVGCLVYRIVASCSILQVVLKLRYGQAVYNTQYWLEDICTSQPVTGKASIWRWRYCIGKGLESSPRSTSYIYLQYCIYTVQPIPRLYNANIPASWKTEKLGLGTTMQNTLFRLLG